MAIVMKKPTLPRTGEGLDLPQPGPLGLFLYLCIIDTLQITVATELHQDNGTRACRSTFSSSKIRMHDFVVEPGLVCNHCLCGG